MFDFPPWPISLFFAILIGWPTVKLVGQFRMQNAQRQILGVLRENGAMSSAAIAKAVGFWSGRLYPALSRLEAKRMISSYWGDRVYEPDGPRRRMYEITGVGRKQLLDVEAGKTWRAAAWAQAR